MAFWMTHLRIADALLRASPSLAAEQTALPFCVGSVAPDSGVELAPFRYDPPKNVTHWHKELPDRLESNLLFYDAYLKRERDPEKRAFYLGYFAHILTDTLFVDGRILPIIEANREVWQRDVWAIKGDWITADYLFAESHPDFFPYRLLCGVKTYENRYLDYFPGDCLEEQVRRVASAFSDPPIERDRPFRYLPPAELDRFIAECTEWLLTLFGKLKIAEFHRGKAKQNEQNELNEMNEMNIAGQTEKTKR